MHYKNISAIRMSIILLIVAYTIPTDKTFFETFFNKFCAYPGGLSRIWIGFTPYCLIYSAKGAEVLLSNPKYLDKTVDYEAMQPWLGTGLLTSSGKKWQHRRKMLTPAFHFKILEDFVEVFNQKSSKFVSNLLEKADGKPFNIFPFITLCTLDIILETAMGSNINVQETPNLDYVESIYEMGRLVTDRQSRPWLQIGFVFKLLGYARRQEKCLKILHSFALEVIKERRRERNMVRMNKIEFDDDVLGKRKRLAFLDLLIESSEQKETLSDEDIREEVDTFMFEGHDTTAVSLNWTLYLLGRHPEAQNRVHEELDCIFGNSERAATPSDIREMKYLECCIKESLRLFPSVPVFGRGLKDDLIIDGHVVPKGTNAIVLTYRLHRDPEHFPEPNSFRPERFLSENSVRRNPYAYIPFSAGPRNCIGQKFAMLEEKVVLSTFLRKFRVESQEKMSDLKLTLNLILKPEKETVVKIFSRK
ncbi:Cytochrome P450 4d2 [Armadillidium nasatum]|uniref:Cytochrome P450 4d2 n=1 Tax=Armadillidium nasatum TaxID=96803 RepID=A0A5N5SY65_9CRUS|nr:Cytochrome P450 4d2 [Armadillidium nasatum]